MDALLADAFAQHALIAEANIKTGKTSPPTPPPTPPPTHPSAVSRAAAHKDVVSRAAAHVAESGRIIEFEAHTQREIIAVYLAWLRFRK